MELIAAIVAAVITVLLTWLIPRALARYNLKNYVAKRNNIDKFFTSTGSIEHVDYMIYQLGIRKKIPLVDLLYFEYLNKAISEGVIREKLLIIPSPDLSSSSQDKDAVLCLQANLGKIFKDNFEKVEVLETFTLEDIDPFSIHLLDAIKYIESRDFIEFINANFTKDIKNFGDFNRYHPADRQLVAIHVHVMTAWMILTYLEQTKALHESSGKHLGFILWETEADKLGIYYYYCTKYRNIEFVPVLGKTILYRKAWTTFCLPVHTEETTLALCDSMLATMLKLEEKDNESWHESKMYYELISAILASNYDQHIPFRTSCLKGKDIVRHYEINENRQIGLGKYSCASIFLLKELRDIYGI